MPVTRRDRRALLLAVPGLLLAGCATPPPDPAVAPAPAAPATPDARVELQNWRVGFIGKVAWGSGTLLHAGTSRRFRFRGAGGGGVGMARIRAEGNVYNLARVEDFAGVYGQVRAGVVLPGAEIPGTLWMINTQGVQVALRPQRSGLALQIGADAVLIELL